jgi:hypothetical protein
MRSARQKVIDMTMQPVGTELRKTGIGVVSDVPWALTCLCFTRPKKICLTYSSLISRLPSLCLWVVSEPLTEEETNDILRRAVTEFERYPGGRKHAAK